MTSTFRSLVSKYQNQVYSLAYYLLANAAEAEDVAQESFIKLWKHLQQLEHGHTEAWLMRVARNEALDRLRQRRVQVTVEEQNLSANARHEPERQWERESNRQKLLEAIQKLEEPWRSLIILRDVHEHSYESVAEILQLTGNQVKVYLHRARKKLTQLWHSEYSVAGEDESV